MSTTLDEIIERSIAEPDVPVCPDHHVPMQIRGKVGRPTRFSDQTEGEYAVLYTCMVRGCANTERRVVRRTQAPVPGIAPGRPPFSRREGRR